MFAKPCGIVVQTKELFGSEGKSQVYAHVHNLLSNKVMEDIGQLLVNVLIRMKTTLHHIHVTNTLPLQIETPLIR